MNHAADTTNAYLDLDYIAKSRLPNNATLGPATAHHTTRSEILPLTGLRFVAAFYVFLFHVQLQWPFVGGALGNIVNAGAAGISLFFILSGYVLSYQYANRPTTWREYTVNRFARIYPVYMLAALMTSPWLLKQMAWEGWPAFKFLGLVATGMTATSAWVPSFFWYWNLSGSWSISAEVFFYSIFPLSLFIARRRKYALPIFIALVLISIIPGILYYVSRVGQQIGLTVFYALPILRAPEFIIGICLHQMGKRWSGRGANALLALSLATLLIALSLTTTRDIFITKNWFVVPLISMVVLGATRCTGYSDKFLSSSIMVQLGKASYCFYSFQAFVILSTVSIVHRLGAGNHLVLLAVIFAVLQTMALVGYKFFEEPARRWLQRRLSPRNTFVTRKYEG
jgi:peptidoglycan/LPS O-acetylase OafA/YrhL